MKPVIQIPAGIHAVQSPSKAHMWLYCLGALGAAKGLPSKPTTVYAAEGTVYHDVTRRALLEGKDCDAYIGDRYEVEGHKFVVDEDNCEFAQKYVDWARSLPGKRFVEVNLEYHHLLGLPKFGPDEKTPIASGTGDLVVLDYENRVVHSGDLKFGRGDIVYATVAVPGRDAREPNAQTALYGAAAADRFEMLGITDDWLVSMSIHQPRANHFDSHTMTVGELKAWIQSKRAVANRAYTLWTYGPERIELDDLTPGEKQCRWCPMSGNCKAQDQKILGMFPKGHAAAVIPTLLHLDDVQIAQSLDLADEVEHWLSAVRGEGLARALRGGVLPNWKLVRGRRGNRALPEDPGTAPMVLDVATATEIGVEEIDPEVEALTMPIEDALNFALADKAYTRKLKTAAQLEKALAKQYPLLWAALQPHITQADGKPALERIEDPRPPLTVMTAEFPTQEAGAAPSLI